MCVFLCIYDPTVVPLQAIQKLFLALVATTKTLTAMNLTTASIPGRRTLFVSILFISLLVSLNTTAQEFIVPAGLPATKEEFVNTEKDMIAAAKWLESTAIGTDMGKSKHMGDSLGG